MALVETERPHFRLQRLKTPDETHHAPSHRRAGSHRVRMEAWQGRFILDSWSFGPYVDLDKGGLLMEAICKRNG
jgi:hypothetical protein